MKTQSILISLLCLEGIDAFVSSSASRQNNKRDSIAPLQSSNYLDALAGPTTTRAPAKSYGPSSFKPSSAPRAAGTGSYLDAVSGSAPAATGASPYSLSTPPAIGQVSNTQKASIPNEYPTQRGGIWEPQAAPKKSASVQTTVGLMQPSVAFSQPSYGMQKVKTLMDSPLKLMQPGVSFTQPSQYEKSPELVDKKNALKLMQPIRATPAPSYYHGQVDRSNAPQRGIIGQPSVAVSGAAFAAGFRNGSPNGSAPQRGLIGQPGVAVPAPSYYHGGQDNTSNGSAQKVRRIDCVVPIL